MCSSDLQLAEAARKHVPELILGMRDRIEAAISDAVEAAQEDDSKAVLRIPIAVKWDIDSTDVEITATVSTRCKASVTVALDDPNQPPLPLDADGDRMTPALAKAVRRLDAAKGGSHE